MAIYLGMMRARRHPASAEFVGSLNLVPVYFSRDKAVLSRYQELISITEDSGWHHEDSKLQLVGKLHSCIAYLLSDMSKAVGVPVDQLLILQGAYAPQQWADDEFEQRRLRKAMLSLLEGELAVPIHVVNFPMGVPEAATDHLEKLPSEIIRASDLDWGGQATSRPPHKP